MKDKMYFLVGKFSKKWLADELELSYPTFKQKFQNPDTFKNIEKEKIMSLYFENVDVPEYDVSSEV